MAISSRMLRSGFRRFVFPPTSSTCFNFSFCRRQLWDFAKPDVPLPQPLDHHSSELEILESELDKIKNDVQNMKRKISDYVKPNVTQSQAHSDFDKPKASVSQEDFLSKIESQLEQMQIRSKNIDEGVNKTKQELTALHAQMNDLPQQVAELSSQTKDIQQTVGDNKELMTINIFLLLMCAAIKMVF